MSKKFSNIILEKRCIVITSSNLIKNVSSPIDISSVLQDIITEDTVIVCIGTDKCTGDSLGPLVGTLLKEKGLKIPVYGTLESPIHALNLKLRFGYIKNFYPHNKIIAIDAGLGDPYSIGTIKVRYGSISPGKALMKDLPEIGDISIVGFVDVFGSTELFSSRGIRLGLVYKMAQIISDGIVLAYNKSLNLSS